MKAKTVFLTNLDEVIIYNAMFHSDNHTNYMKKYYANLKMTEYIPILLTKQDHCVIDLSREYLLGIIYLSPALSEFQKEYFHSKKNVLEKYTLYLDDHSLEKPILIDELLSIIDSKPTRKKKTLTY